MKPVHIVRRLAAILTATAFVGIVQASSERPVQASVSATQYQDVRLISDEGALAPGQPPDFKLLNPWGVAYSPTGPFWVADNNANVITLYNGNGVKQGLTVSVPASGGLPANPTGQVFNSVSTAFMVSSGGKTGSASFILDGEGGTITGWAPSVDTSHAIIAVDNTSTGAVYKGLEIIGTDLFATNFNSGWVEEYDSAFTWIASFRPKDIPKDFAPFNIRQLGGVLYVTFAEQDSAKHDDIAGPSNGVIETLDPATGVFTDFARGGLLNSPWGLALAPSDFGTYSNDLLVGNFGNGNINAYDPSTGKHVGTLTGPTGKNVWIPSLWSLDFGNGGSAGPADWLYYTSGRIAESHGLFGYLIASGGI